MRLSAARSVPEIRLALSGPWRSSHRASHPLDRQRTAKQSCIRASNSVSDLPHAGHVVRAATSWHASWISLSNVSSHLTLSSASCIGSNISFFLRLSSAMLLRSPRFRFSSPCTSCHSCFKRSRWARPSFRHVATTRSDLSGGCRTTTQLREPRRSLRHGSLPVFDSRTDRSSGTACNVDFGIACTAGGYASIR